MALGMAISVAVTVTAALKRAQRYSFVSQYTHHDR